MIWAVLSYLWCRFFFFFFLRSVVQGESLLSFYRNLFSLIFFVALFGLILWQALIMNFNEFICKLPFTVYSKKKLNEVKERENFRRPWKRKEKKKRMKTLKWENKKRENLSGYILWRVNFSLYENSSNFTKFEW